MLLIPKNRKLQNNSMKKHLILLIWMLIFTNCPGWAATYFVSQSGAGSGNGSSYADRMSVADYNNGNLDVSTNPGDTVYLCGTIKTGLNTTEGGSDGAYLIFDGDCSITGGSDVNFQVANSTGMEVDQPYVHIKWGNFTGSTTPGIYINTTSYVKIENSYFTSSHDAGGGIYLKWSNNVTIGGSEGTGNLFENIARNHSGGGDLKVQGNLSHRTEDILISYNEFKGNGVDAGVDAIVFDNAHRDVFGRDGHEIIIEHNYIHNHWRENELDFKGGNYVVIRKNIIEGAHATNDRAAGIVHIQTGADHFYVYGNVFRISDEMGILIWGRDSGGGFKDTKTEHIYIWSNLIYDTDWVGICMSQDSTTPLDDIYIWNNTVVDNAIDTTGCNGTCTGLKTNHGLTQADALNVYNNIFAFNRDGEGKEQTRQLYVLGTTNYTFDYNQYYSAHNSVEIYRNSGDLIFSGKSSWQSAGYDTNGTKADPGFTDRIGDDYTTTSNLIGTKSDATLRAWHPDADKGLGEASDINPQLCANTPGGFVKCAKGIILVDRDNYNDGNWGKGAFVFGSKSSTGNNKKLQVRNLRIKPKTP
jgi:hypothetical protein